MGQISLGLARVLKKLLKFDRKVRFQFHCDILIPRKCLRKTLFNSQCPGTPSFEMLSKIYLFQECEKNSKIVGMRPPAPPVSKCWYLTTPRITYLNYADCLTGPQTLFFLVSFPRIVDLESGYLMITNPRTWARRPQDWKGYIITWRVFSSWFTSKLRPNFHVWKKSTKVFVINSQQYGGKSKALK